MKNKYNIGDIVYLITDPDQYPRIIIAVLQRSNGYSYELGFGSSSSWNSEIEIASDKDITKLFNN